MPYKHHNTIHLGRSRPLALLDMKKMQVAIGIALVAAVCLALFVFVGSK